MQLFSTAAWRRGLLPGAGGPECLHRSHSFMRWIWKILFLFFDCLFICIYIYMYIHICIYIQYPYIYIHIVIQCIYIYMYIYIKTYIQCIYIYVYLYIMVRSYDVYFSSSSVILMCSTFCVLRYNVRELPSKRYIQRIKYHIYNYVYLYTHT